MRGRDPAPKVIVVSSSSKKAGKSTLAAYLVRELGAASAIKVSAGGTHPTGDTVVTDPGRLAAPGTDTAALLDAGAKKVAWVNTSREQVGAGLARAIKGMPGGLLVIEGNSAVENIRPDFNVFLMAVPFQEFKPSATVALSEADLVLVDRSGAVGELELRELKKKIRAKAPRAEQLFYRAPRDRELAYEKAARHARESLGLS